MSSAAPQKVFRRKVFFIPGFDPISPRRYRELYRAEGKAQAERSGYEIEVAGVIDRSGPYRWTVNLTQDGVRTETSYQLLTWNDIVRASMRRSIPSTYLLMLRTLWIYVSSGALIALIRLRFAPMIAAMYPVVILILELLAALLAGWLVAAALVSLTGSALLWLAVAPVLCGALWLFRRYDNRIYAYYLLHDFSFSAQGWGRTPEPMRAREAEFVDAIRTALGEIDLDEVLIVGHSSGAHVGVSVLAEILRHLKGERPAAELGFLSLGAVIPMVSFLPNANQLRADLNLLSRSENITWIDFSAPGDGGCFALCDPVHASGVAPNEDQKIWPKVMSCAFSNTMSEDFGRQTRWRFLRRHIQYLCAFEKTDWYDYFQITAGPVFLSQRFAARGASQSRVERDLSPHKSMAV